MRHFLASCLLLVSVGSAFVPCCETSAKEFGSPVRSLAVESDPNGGVRAIATLLFAAPPERTVREMMRTDVVTVPDDMDQEAVSRVFAESDLMAVPVVDAEGHIKGAVNVDINGDDFAKKVAALDQSKPILIHCQSGARSSRALEEMGSKVKFPTIYHLKSGIKGWQAAEKPVTK